MSTVMSIEMTVINKQQRMNFQEIDYLITFGHPEVLEHSEFPITIGAKKEDFDFYEVGKRYKMLIKPAETNIKFELPEKDEQTKNITGIIVI